MLNDGLVVQPCELCGRSVPEVTEHHLIPKSTHTRSVKAKYRGEEKTRKAWFCIPCHNQIHWLFKNKAIQREMDTIDKIKANPEMAKFIEWIKDKPSGFLPRKG